MLAPCADGQELGAVTRPCAQALAAVPSCLPVQHIPTGSKGITQQQRRDTCCQVLNY